MPFFLAAIIAGFSLAASAIDIACNDASNSANKKVIQLVKRAYTDVHFDELTVATFGTELPTDCDYLSFEAPQKIDVAGDIVIKFDAFKGTAFVKRATKVFRVSGRATILKATQNSHRGDMISNNNTAENIVDVSEITRYTQSKIEKNSHQFKNYIDKGQVIESWMVEKMPDIFKGDAVKAVVKRAKITLTLDARILENGSVGDNVKCKLEKSNKILLGTLHDKKTVIISSL